MLLLTILWWSALYLRFAATSDSASVSDENTSVVEHLDDSRKGVLAALQREIKTLTENTKTVTETTEKLKRKCESEYNVYLKQYNGLMAEIDDHVQEVEKEYESAYSRNEELSHTLDKINRSTELLTLKGKILVEDIQIAKSRQHSYNICENYGTIINFKRKDVATFAQRSRHSRGKLDAASVLYERKKISLEMIRDQEAFTNTDKREYLKYFAGFCRRQIELIKKLIENLKNYPSLGQGIKLMKQELEELKSEITKKEEQLVLASDEFDKLAQYVIKLQVEYDSLTNEVNCFHSLSMWHVDNLLQSFEGTNNSNESVE